MASRRIKGHLLLVLISLLRFSGQSIAILRLYPYSSNPHNSLHHLVPINPHQPAFNFFQEKTMIDNRTAPYAATLLRLSLGTCSSPTPC